MELLNGKLEAHEFFFSFLCSPYLEILFIKETISQIIGSIGSWLKGQDSKLLCSFHFENQKHIETVIMVVAQALCSSVYTHTQKKNYNIKKEKKKQHFTTVGAYNSKQYSNLLFGE